jgi:hypothetical protein
VWFEWSSSRFVYFLGCFIIKELLLSHPIFLRSYVELKLIDLFDPGQFTPIISY